MGCTASPRACARRSPPPGSARGSTACSALAPTASAPTCTARCAASRASGPPSLIRVLTFGRYADSNFGGIERYVFELAQALRGEVEFVNIVAKRGPPPDVPMAGTTLYARPLLELGGTPVCPTMPLHALRQHRRAPFDIGHLQFPADPMAHLAFSLLPRTVKRVIGWHSDVIRQQGLLKLYRPFLNRLLRGADAIVAATPAHVSSS